MGTFPGIAQSGESIQDVTARISALNQVVRQTGTVVNAVTEASQLLQGESERLEKRWRVSGCRRRNKYFRCRLMNNKAALNVIYYFRTLRKLSG